MADSPQKQHLSVLVVLAFCCVVALGLIAWLVGSRSSRVLKHNPAPAEQTRPTPMEPETVIDFGKIQKHEDKALAELMKERKAPYGVDKSLDMIVKSDESIKVGGKTVPMKKILDQVRLSNGEILETDLESGRAKEERRDYGIHVVQPNENIWDIHFKLLRDYYDHKGIHVSPLADEPDRGGRSSGVGKILKFSEHMVHIYNLKEHKLESDLDQIYPLTKIVIYNMSDIFALLDRIDYTDIQRIEFDGETLWLPAQP
ncbi:MAG: hypothetical protein JRI36_01590 [Deltaproteobacteria bacterium]|nr:hypothetical protein [Deltaproteobacteria bacterium]